MAGGPEGVASPEPEGEGLAAAQRLRKRSEIKRVQDSGQRFAGALLVLMVRPNLLGYRRLGVTVSSRVGNAVVRAALKRRFREIFRKHRNRLPPGVDVVIIARGQAAGLGTAPLFEEFRRLAERSVRDAKRGGPTR